MSNRTADGPLSAMISAKSTAVASLVSFVVPTLNRGHYVVRAVESCLRAQAGTTGVTVEVIVVDSRSDDGSWELLLERFDGDSRVRLVQNERGVGPTRSWIDGVKLTKGEFVTFVWSDDYISPRFLHVLLPLLAEKSGFAVGSGAVRDIDEESAFAADAVREQIGREAYLAGYFRRAEHGVRRPVSPACALFRRACLDEWARAVEDWCRSTTLREQVMWRRAIGPDLLLYLIAASMSTNVPMLFEEVVQFSLHKASITVSSSEWILRLGYWLARLWFIECGVAERSVSSSEFSQMAAFCLVTGLWLAMTGPKTLPDVGNVGDMKRAVLVETTRLWRIVRAKRKIAGVTLAVGTLVLGVFASRVRSKLKGLPHG